MLTLRRLRWKSKKRISNPCYMLAKLFNLIIFIDILYVSSAFRQKASGGFGVMESSEVHTAEVPQLDCGMKRGRSVAGNKRLEIASAFGWPLCHRALYGCLRKWRSKLVMAK
jgi:hypothetical protein